jgi:negative regulator of flagellin synthesis FlgM
MDIKNLNNNVVGNRSSEPVKPQGKEAAAGASSAAVDTDRVTLTDVLSQVQRLESKTQDVEISNAERIAAIKAEIQNGTYKVDAERIAEKLIQTEALFAKV